MSSDDEPLIDSAAASRLADLDDAVRARGRAPSSPPTAGRSADSRASLLWQLERRFPRGTASTPDAVAPATSVGPYVIEREIGRGGYGVVLLARHERTDAEVALKIPRPELLTDAAARERFVREAEAMASISHPGIVRTHEVGQIGPLDYIVSEYCPAGSLADRLTPGVTSFTPIQAAKLVQQLAEAVESIHDHGMLHRDLKPSNILLAAGGDPSDAPDALPFKPLVTDFGLAKLVEQSFEQTGTSVMLGTPLYMAPEQAACQNHLVGRATDVYSLGVILYELLTGRTPFVGPGLLAMLNELQTTDPMPPRRLNPAIPRPLAQICLKCLAKDPTDRYPTAAELKEDLQRFLTGGKVGARPLGLRRRFVKWCRRPQRMTNAGVYTVVFNVGMLIWIFTVSPYIMFAEDVNVERLPIVTTVAGLAVTLIIPLVVVGAATIAHRRWAVWVGLALSVADGAITSAGMLGLVLPFGNLYDATPVLRVAMFGLIVSLNATGIFLYACAAVAERYRHRHGEKIRPGGGG